jgi:Flp pilus assembly CpaE family ATPase
VTVLVQGCAGGTGTSTVAALLAGGIARRRRGLRVCVVELGAGHGEHLSDADVDELVARGPAFSPELGVNTLTIDAVGTARLVGTLHRRFDVVVADAGAAIAPDPGLVGVADVVLLVTTPLVTSLRGLERRARMLAGCPAPDARWGGVVVNGARNRVGLDDPARVSAAAQGAPIVAAVPYADRDVTIAINTGRVDRLLDHPDLGPVFARLAERCVPGPVAQLPAPVRVRRPRRIVRRGRAAPAGVSSPFVLDRGDDATAG